MRRSLLMFFFLSMLDCVMLAQEAPAEVEKEQKKPDYSSRALLFIIRDEPVDAAPEPMLGFEVPLGRIRFGWLPSLPVFSGRGAATPMPMVDPFSLLGHQFAFTPQTFRDRAFERRLR